MPKVPIKTVLYEHGLWNLKITKEGQQQQTLIFSQVGKSLGGISLKSPHSNPTFVLSPMTSLLVEICFRAWGRENGTLAHKCAVVFGGQSREALPKPQGLLGWRGNITSLFTKGFLHRAPWGSTYGWNTVPAETS